MSETLELERRAEATVVNARALDGDAGGFSGHFATWGTLNSHNEILMPGAFDDCVDQMIREGWVCRDHNWIVEEQIGYIESSKRDAIGQKTEYVFHTDEAAQVARRRAAERIAAGKTVGMSYAFDLKPDGYRVVSGKDALPYLTNGTPEMKARCAKLANVTIILERGIARVYENSIVVRGSDTTAGVTQVRADNVRDTEFTVDVSVNEIEEEPIPGAAKYVTMYACWATIDLLYYNAFVEAIYCHEEWTVEEKVAHVRRCFEQATELACNAISGIMSDETGERAVEARNALQSLYGLPATLESNAKPRDGIRYEQQAARTRAVVDAFIERTRDLHITKRDSRKLTDDRRALLLGLASDLDTFGAAVRGVVQATTKTGDTDTPAVDPVARIRALRMAYIKPR